MIDTLLGLYRETPFQAVLLTCLLAGLVRGFSGFGTSMIVAPVVAAFYSPRIALILIFMIDGLPALSVVVPELRRTDWREVLPIAGGFALVMPLGILTLKLGDPIALRWLIALTIFLAVAVLWSGWRYNGPRSRGISGMVGGLCGFLGGTSALAGPPAIIYWMASPLPSAAIRANTMVFLFLCDLMIGAGLAVFGLLTLDGILMGIAAAPAYLAGLLLGARMFGFTSEMIYRRIAFAIILLAAISSLPALDTFLRG